MGRTAGQAKLTRTPRMIRRAWAMPSGQTFSIAPIARLLDRILQPEWLTIDPFARSSARATVTNDLNPETAAEFHMDARHFLQQLSCKVYDCALLDPPYSPRQIKDCYQSVGMPVDQCATQHAKLIAQVKDLVAERIRCGGIVITCGWNSAGMGKGRGFVLREILLVNHGGSHNDTIVVVEEKLPTLFDGSEAPCV